MKVYYNEFDPFAAAWLQNLIAAGELPPGDVDTRSIVEVQPDDLKGYDQAHFFAGIGGWPLAVRLAGWGDRPLWTGSCPCQPFSTAGRRRGAADARHLWPVWFRLISVCHPPTIVGEQVASSDGVAWLDAVARDLESVGYAFGASDIGAAGVGAPHLRQRLWFVGHAENGDGRAGERRAEAGVRAHGERGRRSAGAGAAGGLADADRRRPGGAVPAGRAGAGTPSAHSLMGDTDLARPQGWGVGGDGAHQQPAGPSGVAGWLADAGRDEPRGRHPVGGAGEAAEEATGRGQGAEADGQRPEPDAADDGAGRVADTDRGGRREQRLEEHTLEQGPQGSKPHRPRHDRGLGRPWADNVVWLPCREPDGSIVWRPTESGLFPLAHGIPARMGRLRAYGNAVVPQVGAVFLQAVAEVI